MMDFFDCLHRGKAFGVFNLGTSAAGNPMNLQLWNPTVVQQGGSISAYVHRVYVTTDTACYASLGWYNTELATVVRNGTNLNGEDFPTTSNAQSILRTTQQEAAIAASFFKVIRLPANSTFMIPEWVTKLPRGDSTQAGVTTGTGLIVQFSTVIGQVNTASFEWVEVNP